MLWMDKPCASEDGMKPCKCGPRDDFCEMTRYGLFAPLTYYVFVLLQSMTVPFNGEVSNFC